MTKPTARQAALFVTRDGYISWAYVDATPDSITMSIQSLEVARHGQELTFVRRPPGQGIRGGVVLYEEAPAEDE